MPAKKIIFPLAFIFIIGSSNTFSQQKKGFQVGLYTGAFFASNATAIIYDGYGYDLEGQRNDFENSFLNRKINYEYGGANGQPDRIAQALNLNSNEWVRITEKDMPINMRYAPAFLLGLAMRYNANKSSTLLVNLQAAKINTGGNFTIETTPSVNSGTNTWQSKNIQTFDITGTEQRFMLQAGYQRFLSQNEIFNFFFEAGPLMNMIKVVNNKATINSLQIDLTKYYDVQGNMIYQARNLSAVDLGFFAGFGMNLNTGTGWIIQVLYNPSIERIGIGENPGPYPQHAIGLRMYKENWGEGKSNKD